MLKDRNMIIIKIYKDKNNNIIKYNMSGHSGYARQGRDIVCAAVSSMCQMALIGLLEVIKLKVIFDIKDGYLNCEIADNIEPKRTEEANIILNTMILSLKKLENEYKKHIKIIELEV